MSNEPQMTNSAYSLAARICEKDAPPLSLADAPAWCEVLARALLDEAQAFAAYRKQARRVAKTRNPNATCGTCPYWEHHESLDLPEARCGWCRLTVQMEGHPNPIESYWCGEHPDFWATPEEA